MRSNILCTLFFWNEHPLCYFSSWKTCWQTATFLCGAACLHLVLSSFESSHSVRDSAAALASVPDLKRATGGYLFIIWHHTHMYIQTPLLLYLFWERSREVVCVAGFCSRRGTRPTAQSPSEAAAGFSELSKLDLPSSFQSFVFLSFQGKWTEEILSLLISGTQNHGFKPRAKTPQVQFHIKAEKAILFCHVTLPKKAYIMLKCYLYSCHRRYNINN